MLKHYKKKKAKTTATSTNTDINNFLSLPEDLVNFLMQYLSLSDMDVLSKTSKDMSKHFTLINYVQLSLKSMLAQYEITPKDLLIDEMKPKELYLLYKKLNAAENGSNKCHLLLNYASKGNKPKAQVISKILPFLTFDELVKELTYHCPTYFLDDTHQMMLDKLYKNVIKQRYPESLPQDVNYEYIKHYLIEHLICAALLKQTDEISKLIEDERYQLSLDEPHPKYNIITPLLVIRAWCPKLPTLILNKKISIGTKMRDYCELVTDRQTAHLLSLSLCLEALLPNGITEETITVDADDHNNKAVEPELFHIAVYRCLKAWLELDKTRNKKFMTVENLTWLLNGEVYSNFRNLDLILIQLLIKMGADVNNKRSTKGFLIECAILEQKSSFFRVLIKSGANTNITFKCSAYSYTENTPLTLSIRKQSLDYVKILVDAGVDLNKRTGRQKSTPLFYAAKRNLLDIMQVLLKAGARVNKNELAKYGLGGDLWKLNLKCINLLNFFLAIQQQDYQVVSKIVNNAFSKKNKADYQYVKKNIEMIITEKHSPYKGVSNEDFAKLYHAVICCTEVQSQLGSLDQLCVDLIKEVKCDQKNQAWYNVLFKQERQVTADMINKIVQTIQQSSTKGDKYHLFISLVAPSYQKKTNEHGSYQGNTLV